MLHLSWGGLIEWVGRIPPDVLRVLPSLLSTAAALASSVAAVLIWLTHKENLEVARGNLRTAKTNLMFSLLRESGQVIDDLATLQKFANVPETTNFPRGLYGRFVDLWERTWGPGALFDSNDAYKGQFVKVHEARGRASNYFRNLVRLRRMDLLSDREVAAAFDYTAFEVCRSVLVVLDRVHDEMSGYGTPNARWEEHYQRWYGLAIEQQNDELRRAEEGKG